MNPLSRFLNLPCPYSRWSLVRLSLMGASFLISYLVLATLFSGFVSISPTTTCKFPAIFNFGDSNSDTGGLSAVFGQVGPPNGETFFHNPVGRYCDGRLVIDFIAQSLGLPFVSAYLDSMGANFSHGINFATSASTIVREIQNITVFQSGYSPISLDFQVVQFSDFQKRSQIFREKGSMCSKKSLPEDNYFSRGLYTFDIGQNDLTVGYVLNMTIEQVKGYVPDLMLGFSNAMKEVYDLGGRTFWIHNTGPVGCYPYILTRYPTDEIDKYGCASPYNEVAQYFNLKLKEAVDQLKNNLPLAAITYVDLYTAKYTLITEAEKYGFELPLVACCGYGGKYNFQDPYNCGAKIKVDGKEVIVAKSCKDPSVRISWDGIHFTEAANKWIFDQIAQGSYSDPPVPLAMACHARSKDR